MYHLGGYATSGSYFVYKGVRYGRRTLIHFTKEFEKNVRKHVQPGTLSNLAEYPGRFRRPTPFNMIKEENGQLIWAFGSAGISDRFVNFVPDRDIAEIVTPVFYLTPKEMAKQRLKDGTWIAYVWPQTLFYIFCLLISPLFKQWYIIWTTGLYLYLRVCYIELSRGVLYE